MGYSFESAIADIIDNSISAHATEIIIRFPIVPADCYVAIYDNGYGMSSEGLFDAMKYGSEAKREGRSSDDLGRFGLGLKAASLSQCRKLTVASKKNEKISAYIWDLDIIEQEKDWYVVECSAEQIDNIRFIEYLVNNESGTLVVWENFDVIEKAAGNVFGFLSNHINEVSDYLSLIFHRYLNRNDKTAVKRGRLAACVTVANLNILTAAEKYNSSARSRASSSAIGALTEVIIERMPCS